MFSTRIVNTNSGPVRGRIHEGLNNTKSYLFLCIPYGKSPVGDLRFKAPQKVDPWTEVFDATEQGASAYQPKGLITGVFAPSPTRPQSENCLYLNLYMKSAHIGQRRKLPVMVMLHYGGFMLGSSNDNINAPDFLLEHDVLYASINFRLGAFGFLSIPDPTFDIPGNAGLKDQALALRWLGENCEHFGGDAENITLMGISSGAASIHYHMCSDHSKGLFHRAILQSGSALNAWANRSNNDDLNERLARALGWSGTGGDAAMWRTIIDAPADEIVKFEMAIINAHELQNGLIFTFVPVIEPYDNGTVFVDRDLREMNRTGWGHRIPILIGGVADEGYLLHFVYLGNPKMFDDEGYFENALPRELGHLDADERQRLGAKLREFYYGNEKPTMQNIRKYVNLLTEKLFWHGINAIMKARVENPSSAPTYLYHFDYSSDVLLEMEMMMCGKHVEGTVHGEDIAYAFRVPSVHDVLNADSYEVQLIEAYNSMLASFAATGKPSSMLKVGLDWQPVSGSAPFKCMNIGQTLSVIDLPNTKRLQFWDSLCEY